MNTRNNNNKLKKGCLGCLGSLVLFFLFVFFTAAGHVNYGQSSLTTPVMIGAVVLALIFFILKGISKNYQADTQAEKDSRQQVLNTISEKYNEQIKALKEAFDKETDGFISESKNTIGQKYDRKFQELETDYRIECRQSISQLKSDNQGAARLEKIWKTGLGIGLAVVFSVICYIFGLSLEPEPKLSPLMEKAEKRTWNAEQIPMPHLEDATKYVSNPDSILSEAVVDSMDNVLYRLDTELGIESAVVIVGHIEGDDPIPMVRGIYNKYGIGRDNRGLVIVVGYLDHSYFIAPGRNLEADLTDTETDMLAKKYLIPSMKAEKPDSGMLYLVRGTYALMAQKDMPRMSALTSNTKSKEDEGVSFGWGLALVVILLSGGGLAFYRKFKEMGWTDYGGSHLAKNPFYCYRPVSSGDSGSGGSYSSSSSSSHSSGGSYGGGSWGGGGSGGRW